MVTVGEVVTKVFEVADGGEEALEGGAVVQILAGMDLVGDVDAGLVEAVEDRAPAAAELVEGGLDQARRALRPRRCSST